MADSAKLQLYSYWRSSSSHRVRIVLNLKGLEYEYKPVNLLKNEQSTPEFAKLNPLKYVPVLVDGDAVIADSFVITLYLEDKYPEHPLLPKDLKNKALNLQVASIVGSSIQPLHNLGVLNYIEGKLNSNEKVAWAQYHINYGFEEDHDSAKDCIEWSSPHILRELLKDQEFGCAPTCAKLRKSERWSKSWGELFPCTNLGSAVDSNEFDRLSSSIGLVKAAVIVVFPKSEGRKC
ncbi:Glutathione S-transferase zeta class [Dendrobium catenatum]|uniref:glutathione transferase n=1 Tax=Dendrobium catenatum TaxID=906689 RepID=A0A2I0VS68_9ASPA|nr:Glutathione S-transferase zeta class [Dendrobium catenatum]